MGQCSGEALAYSGSRQIDSDSRTLGKVVALNHPHTQLGSHHTEERLAGREASRIAWRPPPHAPGLQNLSRWLKTREKTMRPPKYVERPCAVQRTNSFQPGFKPSGKNGRKPARANKSRAKDESADARQETAKKADQKDVSWPYRSKLP